MRRTVLLLRHAKADREAGAGSDHDRPLTAEGRRAAKQLGAWLSEADLAPDLLLTSSAVRALATAELAAAAGRWRCPCRAISALYGASPTELVELLRGLEPEVERPLLVGHEPVWSNLATLLIGGGHLRLPTGAVAAVRFELPSWGELTPGEGELLLLVAPKRL
jgi:phosphohistidine phosphatase